MNDRQKTFSREASFEGPGLFSGETTRLTFAPAAPGSGITFVREQDGKAATIPAIVQNVLKRPRRTCLRNGTLFVETVEHCMAALAGMGVCNAVVRVSGGQVGELPGGDGSSRPFVEVIQEAGLTEQDAPLEPLIVRKPVQVSAEGATLAALPGSTDRLEVIYDFEAPPPIGRQTISFRLGDDDFIRNLAPARTFVWENEAKELQARGLGKHLTPKELLVISPTGPIDNAFRFVDECGRHKVLDLIGDLFLVGRPIRGRIVAYKSGHHLNHLLARKLLEQEEASLRQSLVHRDAEMDIRRIQRILPHRYPMLLVDRVLEIVGDAKALVLKTLRSTTCSFRDIIPARRSCRGS